FAGAEIHRSLAPIAGLPQAGIADGHFRGSERVLRPQIERDAVAAGGHGHRAEIHVIGEREAAHFRGDLHRQARRVVPRDASDARSAVLQAAPVLVTSVADWRHDANPCHSDAGLHAMCLRNASAAACPPNPYAATIAAATSAPRAASVTKSR